MVSIATALIALLKHEYRVQLGDVGVNDMIIVKKNLKRLGARVAQQTPTNTVPLFTMSPRSNLIAARRTYHRPPPDASYDRDGGGELIDYGRRCR